ncbi:MAG: dihydroorotate dehydrogenase electron transfer subunit [Bacteroidetes bacterium]|nr:dihydroorotate dehydrogenase electron transfer subunit [Bacteroidota bacterium]MBU1115646.1 dihydroorotate dehydrogenase electron transfer subunit [Bacteroidota bacterium]MBU1798709.1 dihydroorotate dehydrogenase electron transfer subunit [Bacteroidota bacterium]
MIEKNGIVEEVIEIQNGVYILRVKSQQIADEVKPGQFCNIKVDDSLSPFLRRPFSVCDVEDGIISFQFNLVGEGTRILSKKKNGDVLNIIGPLGVGFDYSGIFENAIIVAGGIGAAPFPLLINELNSTKNIISFIGGRSQKDLIKYKLKNIVVSTDDGSEGFHGNVVQLLESEIHKYDKVKTKIFACGPNPMLRALSKFTIENGYNCEISTESVMACGFGICQGCNIESVNSDRFLLVCKDGPVFKAEDVKL